MGMAARMDNGTVRVLMIEDDPDDYSLMRELLGDDPENKIVLEWVSDFDAGLDAITRGEHDAFLVDYRLGKDDGLKLLREGLRLGCKAPMILLTGQGDRDLALQALDAGASDYLIKGKIDAAVLERSIRYALQQKRHADELERKVADRTAELERANAALHAGEEALKDADRRKDEFLATLAHELRNPLAPVRNAVEILRMKGPDIPELHWARDIIDRQTQAMAQLIDDLMDISRINLGKLKLKREQVELANIVQGAIETSRPLIENMGHELTMTLPPGLVIVDADRTRLAQVFLNLLNNAAKYTERGGRIDLRAELQGSDVVVSVTDSGIGIPVDKLPTIFEMFSQVEGALSRSQGGLGIGLSLVKRLVEMHGGSVEARSGGAGQGSEFLVRLPIVVEQTYSSEANDDGDHATPTSDLRILVVDDNRDAAESLAMLLTATGNNVQTAHDGEKAVAAAGKFRPHVVLCDIGLQKLNGYEACRQMKAQAWDKKMVLIAVTGWGQDDDRRKSEEAGFDHHMVKPVDPKSLMKLLAGLETV